MSSHAEFQHTVSMSSWKTPDANAGALWISLDEQTARLEMANGRTADVTAIVDRCEAERAKALAAPKTLWTLRLP